MTPAVRQTQSTRRSSVAEELLAIDDGAIDFACRDELTRIVSGAHTEGESAAGGHRWCLSDDLDRAAHRGCASVLDARTAVPTVVCAPVNCVAACIVAASIHAMSRGVASTATSPLPTLTAVSASVTS